MSHYNKDWYERNKERLKPIRAKYYQEHRKQYAEWRKRLYFRNIKVEQQKRKDYYYKNRERCLANTRRYNQRIKQEVLTHYGNGKLACVICGESRMACLSIDHIEGGGYKHKKQLGSRNFYLWLKQQGYPKGYQTLCMNCQFLKKEQACIISARKEVKWKQLEG